MKIVEARHALQYWFAERNINTEGLTVILNFQDAQPGVHVDWELKKDLGAMLLPPADQLMYVNFN